MKTKTRSSNSSQIREPFSDDKVVAARRERFGDAVFVTAILATFPLLTGIGIALNLNLSTVSLLYLLITVFVAIHSGFWQASAISVFAVICQSYFFAPPTFTFYIADPKNGVAIIVFEIAVLVVSRVSSRERENAVVKKTQKRTLQQLYAVNRGALYLDLNESPEQQLADLIRHEFSLEAVAVLESASSITRCSGRWVFPAGSIAQKAMLNLALDELHGELSSKTLLVGGVPIGCLLVMGRIGELTMDSPSSLVALTMDKHRAFTNAGLAEAAKQTEQLRTTVLDGLAHAFKTPLTIIRAASSGLLEMGHLHEAQDKLFVLIDEQSMWLDNLASRLLKTASLDGDLVHLQTELVSIPILIEEVLQDLRSEWTECYESSLATPSVNIAVSNQNLCVLADHEMLASTLKELLSNSAKYSSAGTPIYVSAIEDSTELLISVRSCGPAIPLSDREHIFELFYRSANHQSVAPGIGIGLSVARRVTEAHGGQIWVISDEKDGNTFNFSLPLHKE